MAFFIAISAILLFTLPNIHCGIQKQKIEPKSLPSVKRDLVMIRDDCGQVCDMTISGVEGKYYDKITKDFQCDILMESPMFDKLASKEAKSILDPNKPLHREEIEPDILELFTYGGRIPMFTHYLDDSEWSDDEKLVKQPESGAPTYGWDRKTVESMRSAFRIGKLRGGYGYNKTENIGRHLRDHMANQIRDGHVLIIGSQSPWVEAIVLEIGAAKITTLEYADIVTDHPQLTTTTPDKLSAMFLDNPEPIFNAVVTFSSLEHGGLGRYGEALNPWTDLITMAKAWCLTKPGGRALVGVPTGFDGVMFNANRIYGPYMYSHLFANWDQIYTEAEMFKDGPETHYKDIPCKEEDAMLHAYCCYEPVHVLEKPKINNVNFKQEL